jgi:two-component system chemotaxis response regulator CheY
MAKILIVDDAAFMRMMVKDNLKKAGYSDFLEAGDGEDAVNNLQKTNPIWYFWTLQCRLRMGSRLCNQ